jgi:hypothetical protein
VEILRTKKSLQIQRLEGSKILLAGLVTENSIKNLVYFDYQSGRGTKYTIGIFKKEKLRHEEIPKV